MTTVTIDCIKLLDSSYIFYITDQNHTYKEYYDYIVTTIKDLIITNKLLNKYILIGNVYKSVIIEHFSYLDIDFSKLISFYLNHEHNLVYKGYGIHEHIGIIDIIKTTNVNSIELQSDKYSVRIHDYDILNLADYVCEYSMPNIINITTSGKYEDFSKKLIYIPPLIFNTINLTNNDRKYNLVTTFFYTHLPRRNYFLTYINKYIPCTNVNGHWGLKETYDTYMNTKVIINIHQTDTHHTFEELRVLPAILCGVIIISENVPLKETIPYNEFILWGENFEDIVKIAIEVTNNYEIYYNKLYGPNSKLVNIIENMNQNCNDSLLKILQ